MDEIDTKGWEVVEVCPECGLERTYDLTEWLGPQHPLFNIRRLKSYCEKTGKSVWMRYTGWRRKTDGR